MKYAPKQPTGLYAYVRSYSTPWRREPYESLVQAASLDEAKRDWGHTREVGCHIALRRATPADVERLDASWETG